MRKSQEANDSVSIEQEQADQVRRTVGATLAARALEEVLPAIGKGYAPQTHARVAERMVRDMDKPNFTFTVDRYEPDDDETGCRMIVNSNATQHNAGEAASLLEAAPDMYAALSGLIDFFDRTRPGGRVLKSDPDIDAARAALSAARGEGRGG